MGDSRDTRRHHVRIPAIGLTILAALLCAGSAHAIDLSGFEEVHETYDGTVGGWLTSESDVAQQVSVQVDVVPWGDRYQWSYTIKNSVFCWETVPPQGCSGNGLTGFHLLYPAGVSVPSAEFEWVDWLLPLPSKPAPWSPQVDWPLTEFAGGVSWHSSSVYWNLHALGEPFTFTFTTLPREIVEVDDPNIGSRCNPLSGDCQSSGVSFVHSRRSYNLEFDPADGTLTVPGALLADADGDTVPDDHDLAPMDASRCSDFDRDGCDDCASGSFDPADDDGLPGPDPDGVCADFGSVFHSCPLNPPDAAGSKLVAWWKADGDATDAHGSAHGTVENGVGFEPGQLDQAFAFDGVDDRVRVGTDDSPFRQAVAITYAFWAKLPAGGGGYVMGTATAAGQGYGGLYLDPNILQFAWTPSQIGPLGPTALASDRPIRIDGLASLVGTDEWHHYAVTIDHARREAGFYVDGERQSHFFSHPDPTEIVLWNPASVYNTRPEQEEEDTIGGRWFHNPLTAPAYFSAFEGSIDDVQIYARALPEAEVRGLYREAAGQCDNEPPTANAGMPETVHPGMLVVLDGSASSDPDDDPLTYDWEFFSLPPGSGLIGLTDPTSPMPSFTPDVLGEYEVQLIVTDDGGLASAPDTVTISTFNSAPVADAGDNIGVIEIGTEVHLDGSRSDDDDGDPLTFQWNLQRPAGSTAVLYHANLPTPFFVADVRGTYVATLVVTDVFGASSPVPPDETGTVIVAFHNLSPEAEVRGPAVARVGQTVRLDGSHSSDPNLDPLAFYWTLIDSPPGSGADLATVPGRDDLVDLSPDVSGPYTVSLRVYDGDLLSSPDTHLVQATTLAGEAMDLVAQIDAAISNETLMPIESFDGKQNRRQWFQKKLANVTSKLGSGDYQGALDLVEASIPKTDGCAASGAPDPNDKVTVCGLEGQERVYPDLVQLAVHLRGLIFGVQTIQIDFTGQLTSLTTGGVPGAPQLEGMFSVGDLVVGRVVFETVGWPSSSTPTATLYDRALASLDVSIGGYVAHGSGGRLTVYDDHMAGTSAPLRDAFFATATSVTGSPVSGLSPALGQFGLESDDLSVLASTQIPGVAELQALEDLLGGGTNYVAFSGPGLPNQQVRFDLTSFVVQEVSAP